MNEIPTPQEYFPSSLLPLLWQRIMKILKMPSGIPPGEAVLKWLANTLRHHESLKQTALHLAIYDLSSITKDREAITIITYDPSSFAANEPNLRYQALLNRTLTPPAYQGLCINLFQNS